jgi:basic membrane lipoprotein Med (substrate-binding protein (PBP1-ABC) superfamily)
MVFIHHQARSTMKKDQPPTKPPQHPRVLNTVILITGLIAILWIANAAEEGLQIIAGVSSSLFGDNPKTKNSDESLGYNDADLEYSAVKDASAPSYVFLINKLKNAGLEPDLAEFSVHEFSESSFSYRWNRAGKVRKWEVYKDHAGDWMIYETPP